MLCHPFRDLFALVIRQYVVGVEFSLSSIQWEAIAFNEGLHWTLCTHREKETDRNKESER